jgi:hypothetical protein
LDLVTTWIYSWLKFITLEKNPMVWENSRFVKCALIIK